MCDISVIIPVFNGEKWINQCMQSIATQTIHATTLKIEIVVFDDGSNDNACEILKKWSDYFHRCGIAFVFTGSQYQNGVGAAKNGAIRKSTGQFLCFQDVDDIMLPNRMILQWDAANKNRNALIGSKVIRVPTNSTPRFTNWANTLSPDQLKLQIYTSNGPTLLMPTWFCHRSVYEKVGGFDETRSGIPEDLLFFYAHLDLGGDLIRVDEKLIIYTYHEGATTFSISREKIWLIQLKRIEELVLPYWNTFTIWNAGKAGRRLVRSLSNTSLKKVVAFCDVDKNKIGKTIELYCPVKRKVIIKLPVVHFTKAKAPLLICIKLDLTKGEFENNLKSLNLTEGKDYMLFI